MCSVALLCPTLCDPIDYSPPGFSVHGISQTRILEWVAISFSRRSSWPRDWTHVSCTGSQILYHWATREAYNVTSVQFSSVQSPTVCDSMDCSMPGLPVHHRLLGFTQLKWSEVAQSCLTLWDPMDCSLPGSSVHGILQARILEWVAIPFSRRSSQSRDWTWFSHIASRRFTIWTTRELVCYKCISPRALNRFRPCPKVFAVGSSEADGKPHSYYLVYNWCLYKIS